MASYCGAAPLPDEWIGRWNLDPALLLGVLACTFLALRSAHPRLALGGVAILALAFVSPLCGLSVALFSARAVHHILLVAFAAPLISMAFPARHSGQPGLPLLVATITLWLWHLPFLYDHALTDTAIYWLMQTSLTASAVWFWRALFAAPPLSGILASILAMMQMGLLGALLTFAPDPLYAAHATAPLAWGMAPLADQQLAGLIMWVPGIIPYGIVTALIARRIWTRAAAKT